ncbi:hypothetical protein [Methylocapsa aurea]|uniref:hypothetical protein n=1 Tax=Methylocapsa aurea TaxID=663610 RepID=UPI000563C3ED|nr:hypothetical protein [Methylocapsa aurea]
MLFSIDEDVGERIIGWLMPDNPAATPRILVHLDFDHHVVVEAFVYRPLLKEQGLHNTGVCGFIVDEANCPGVSAATRLEIIDADNNVLIYRRRNTGPLTEQKFLRLETQLFRSSGIDEQLAPQFQMSYQSMELLPEETTRSIFAIPFTNSIFSSGRIFFRIWEPLLRDRGFKIGILLREPFEELSERLLILKWASSPDVSSAVLDLMPALQTCAGALRDVDITDASALDAVLSHPSDEMRALLYNPLVYQLAAPNAFDPPPPGETAATLDALAEMDVVGIHADLHSFFDLLTAVLDLPDPLAELPLAASKTVIGFADILREMRSARALIEKDLEVYAEAIRILVAPSDAKT